MILTKFDYQQFNNFDIVNSYFATRLEKIKQKKCFILRGTSRR